MESPKNSRELENLGEKILNLMRKNRTTNKYDNHEDTELLSVVGCLLKYEQRNLIKILSTD